MTGNRCWIHPTKADVSQTGRYAVRLDEQALVGIACAGFVVGQPMKAEARESTLAGLSEIVID
jgi:hypothetical protein